jgi:hypothetical protein
VERLRAALQAAKEHGADAKTNAKIATLMGLWTAFVDDCADELGWDGEDPMEVLEEFLSHCFTHRTNWSVNGHEGLCSNILHTIKYYLGSRVFVAVPYDGWEDLSHRDLSAKNYEVARRADDIWASLVRGSLNTSSSGGEFVKQAWADAEYFLVQDLAMNATLQLNVEVRHGGCTHVPHIAQPRVLRRHQHAALASPNRCEAC